MDYRIVVQIPTDIVVKRPTTRLVGFLCTSEKIWATRNRLGSCRDELAAAAARIKVPWGH